jgi:hypothetical protein
MEGVLDVAQCFRDVLHIDQVTGAFDGSYVIMSGTGDLSRMPGGAADSSATAELARTRAISRWRQAISILDTRHAAARATRKGDQDGARRFAGVMAPAGCLMQRVDSHLNPNDRILSKAREEFSQLCTGRC